MTAVLSIEGLSFGVRQRLIAERLSFDVCANSLSVLVGPVGSGKSTLLSVLAGTVQSTAIWFDVDRATYAGAPLDETNRPAHIPQDPKRGAKALMAALDAALERDPALLLLDEASVGLTDAEAAALLRRLRSEAQRRAILHVTHNMGQARAWADHAILLASGHVQEAGPADRFFSRPQNPATRHFLQTGGTAGPAPGAQSCHLAPELRPMPPDVTLSTATNGPGRVRWVIDGRLGVADRTAHPTALAADGVTTLVNLGSADVSDPDPQGDLASHGIVGVWFPVSGGAGAVGSGKLLCQECQRLLDARERVAVFGGPALGTPARVVASQLIHLGVSADKAAAVIAARLPDMPLTLEDEQFLWDLELSRDLDLDRGGEAAPIRRSRAPGSPRRSPIEGRRHMPVRANQYGHRQ